MSTTASRTHRRTDRAMQELRSPDQQTIRTAVFVVATACLVAVTRSGASWPLVIFLLFIFTVAATVWVRGQYVESLLETQWRLWITVAAGAIGLGLVLYFATSLGIVSFVIVYFGLGALVARWRQTQQSNPTLSIALTVGGAVVAVVGIAGLGTFPHLIVGICALLAGLLLPIGVALFSEAAIRELTPPDEERARSGVLGLLPSRGKAAAAGCVGALVTTVVAAVMANSTLILIPIAVLCALIVVMASSTQADIVAVMIVLALMGVTPQQAAAPAPEPAPGSVDVLVALGDSYMSGEGASIYYEHTDEGDGNQCRRAPTAWAAMAGERRPFDGFVFLACSGARTWNMEADPAPGSAITPTPQPGEPDTQLRQYDDIAESADFTPRLVVVSVGGNDAGFSTIGMMCMAPGNCSDRNQQWIGAMPQVEERLDSAYSQIRERFPSTPVAVIPYTDPIDNSVERCSQVVLTAPERSFIHDFVVRLNDSVEKVAAKHDFYFIGGVQDALRNARAQLCDPLNEGRPGLNFIGLRSVNGLADQRYNPSNWLHGSLHPNERGHTAVAAVVSMWLDDAGRLSADGTYSGATPPSAMADSRFDSVLEFQGGADSEDDQCKLFGARDGEVDCRSAGVSWAEQQVRDLLLKYGIIFVAILALSVWLVSVSFFAWRREAHGGTVAASGGALESTEPAATAARAASEVDS